ncbi:hypothetical protein GW17_00051885, partial [Ensete ventricosum]
RKKKRENLESDAALPIPSPAGDFFSLHGEKKRLPACGEGTRGDVYRLVLAYHTIPYHTELSSVHRYDAASSFTSSAWYGRAKHGRTLCSSSTNAWHGNASDATFWNANNGKLLRDFAIGSTCDVETWHVLNVF